MVTFFRRKAIKAAPAAPAPARKPAGPSSYVARPLPDALRTKRSVRSADRAAEASWLESMGGDL